MAVRQSDSLHPLFFTRALIGFSKADEMNRTEYGMSGRGGARRVVRLVRRRQAPRILSTRVPAEIYEELERAERASQEGRLPFTILRSPDRPAKDALVVVRLSTFTKYFDSTSSKEVG